MILIPAIDLHDGRCVQLKRGLLDTATVYADDPGGLATHWREQGAERIHVVDLDGAFSGHTENANGIKAIVEAAESVPIQLGGGIRSLKAVENHLSTGVSQVIIGTQAIEDPAFFIEATRQFPSQVILGLDARSGFVSTRGWQSETNVPVDEVLSDFSELSIFAIVFTDIESDGMLSGVNVNRTEAVLSKTEIPVIASGGVNGIADLEKLRVMRAANRSLYGVISGSALYEGALDFKRGQRVLNVDI